MIGVSLIQFLRGVKNSLGCIPLFFEVLENKYTQNTITMLLVYNLLICLVVSLIFSKYLNYLSTILTYNWVYYGYVISVTLFWSLPHYLIGLMYNSYYTNQSISIFIETYNPQNVYLRYSCYGSYSKYLVNKCYYLIIVTFLTLETVLIGQIPYIGRLTDWFLTSLIYSYYSWEYSWSSHKIPHQERYSIFENNWCYYLGYGSLLGLIKINMGFFQATSLIACLFPIYGMNSLLLYKKVHITDQSIKLPLFYLPIKYANVVVNSLSEYIKNNVK